MDRTVDDEAQDGPERKAESAPVKEVANINAKKEATEENAEEIVIMTEDEWRNEMLDLLDTIERQGDYCTGGKIQLPALQPAIIVKGMKERLAFPLCQAQAEELRSVAEQAPYGKGTTTVIDETVRKAWQVDASNVTFHDSATWDSCLKQIVTDRVASLGLSNHQLQSAQANLYKLLLYEPGGHFQKHRDTEKEPGMFGTLVIQLPAKFEGGSLVLEHSEETKTIDFSAESDSAFFATAFFADCEHQLMPVTSGWRLCLVYNLVLAPNATTPTPTADAITAHMKELRALAKQWEMGASSETIHGYLLEHKYTETNCRFRNLKGRDKEVVDFLRETRDENGNRQFEVFLLLIKKWESGEAEGGGYDTYRRGYCDSFNDSYTMGEVYDSGIDVENVVGSNDEVLNFNLQVDLDSSLLNADELDERFGEDPDKQEAEGYTGNAGPTLDYWYYCSAVVFFPRSRQLEFGAAAGLPFLINCFESASASEKTRLAIKAVEMLEAQYATTEARVWDSLIECLLKLGDEVLVARALKAAGRLNIHSVGVVRQVAVQMPSKIIKAAILLLLQKNSAAGHYFACCEILNSLPPSPFLTDAQDAVVSGAVSNAVMLFDSTNGVQRIAQAVAESPDALGKLVEIIVDRATPSQISSTLALLMKTEGAVSKAPILKLAICRSQQLKVKVAEGAPEFSWSQPQANFAGSQAPSVNEFLRSIEVSKTFKGFDGIGHARNWARKYFSGTTHYSARAVPGGIGKNAYVTVTKTTEAFELLKRTYRSEVQELERITRFFGPANVGSTQPEAAAAAVSSTASSAALKRSASQSVAEQSASDMDVQNKRSKAASAGDVEDPICLD